MLKFSRLKFLCVVLFTVISLSLLMMNAVFIFNKWSYLNDKRSENELISRIEELKVQKENLNNEMPEMQKLHSERDAEVRSLNAKVQKLESDKDLFTKENNELNNSKKILEEQIGKLQEQEASLKDRIDKLQKKKDADVGDLDRVARELNEVSKELESKQNIIKECKDLQDKKQKLNDAINNMEKELQRLDLLVKEKTKRQENLQNSIEQLESQNNDLESKKDELKAEISGSEAARNSLYTTRTELQAKCAYLQERLIILKEEELRGSQLVGRLKSLDEELNTKSEELSRLEEKIKISRAEEMKANLRQ